MKKISVILILVMLTVSYSLKVFSAEKKPIKEPNVNGTFYPAEAGELSMMVDKLIKNAHSKTGKEQIYGIISPHAGYIYSGSIAALAYKKIYGKNYSTVIILSPAHHAYIDKIAVYKKGFFKTPLGLVKVDSDFSQRLLALSKNFVEMPQVFEKEHAVEVQIPFLQRSLKNFSIVPVIIPGQSYELCQDLANNLAALIANRNDVLVVASSDMSHFHDKKTANSIDNKTLEYIKENSPEKVFQSVQAGECELCGVGAVTTLMLTMKKLGVNKIELLGYATSADTTNTSKKRVVGYSSFIFFKSKEKSDMKKKKGEELMLSEAQKSELINVARKSMTDYITLGKRQKITASGPLFLERRGAFVTLKKKGALRGCIGRIIADKPLINVIDEMAIQASTADPRFPPVRKEELKDISIEISVLSPLKEISDISQIEVGKHGLIIQKGFHMGLLLPQVPTEYGWSKEEFLEHTCLKAGLDPEEWKKGVNMRVFSAEVFGENE